MQTVTISTAILRGAVKTAYTKYLEDYNSALMEYNTRITAYGRQILKLAKEGNLTELELLKRPSQPVSRSTEFERLIAALNMTSLDETTISASTFDRCVMNIVD
jgi:hypothetical protein